MTLIDEARRLLEAATPGPWEVRQDCEYWDVYPPDSIHPIGDGPDETCFEADARLIAFLRNNADRLCDVLEAAERERDQARAEVAELQRWVNDLQAGMYINCVYCGHRYGPGSEVPAVMADVLYGHIAQCPKHPLSVARAHLRTLVNAVKEFGDDPQVVAGVLGELVARADEWLRD